MGRKLTSPVERWPGYIIVSDPLTLPQTIAMQKAIRKAEELGQVSTDEQNAVLLPGLWECLDEWNIEGIDQDVDMFPSSPHKESLDFVTWLFNSVREVYNPTEELPNG